LIQLKTPNYKTDSEAFRVLLDLMKTSHARFPTLSSSGFEGILLD